MLYKVSKLDTELAKVSIEYTNEELDLFKKLVRTDCSDLSSLYSSNTGVLTIIFLLPRLAKSKLCGSCLYFIQAGGLRLSGHPA